MFRTELKFYFELFLETINIAVLMYEFWCKVLGTDSPANLIRIMMSQKRGTANNQPELTGEVTVRCLRFRRHALVGVFLMSNVTLSLRWVGGLLCNKTCLNREKT